MLIELKRIAEGGLHVERALDLGLSEADGEVAARGPAQVAIDIHEVEDEIVVSGRFEVIVTLACARCLESFDLQVADRFTSIYRLRPEEFEEEVQVRDGDLDLSFLAPDQEALDLREIVEEQVLLNIPMKPLHDPECKGLCPRCGTNRNEQACDCEEEGLDPRLEELARIRAAMDRKQRT